MLLTHWIRRAASRAACTVGNSNAIRTAMIAITTRSSISVKPLCLIGTSVASPQKVRDDHDVRGR